MHFYVCYCFACDVTHAYFESELAFGGPFFLPHNPSEFGSGLSLLLLIIVSITPASSFTLSWHSFPLAALFMATIFIDYMSSAHSTTGSFDMPSFGCWVIQGELPWDMLFSVDVVVHA